MDSDLDPDAAAALGRAWLDDRPRELLTDLTAMGSRMAGSEGEARAAVRVREAFEAAGLRDVRTDPFEMRRWDRGRTSLRLRTPVERTFEAVALPYSPAAEVAGDLVDVGHGTPGEVDAADLDGAVAVASTTTPSGSRFVHRMEKFGHAVDAGAEAFVFVNHVPGQLPPTGSLRFGETAEAPAVGVSRETGAWLREYARDGGADGSANVDDRPVPDAPEAPETPDAPGTVELSVEAETRPAESRNVLGRLGPVTDEELLAVAHYDAHDIAEGALDNGCGVATLVTAARVLAAIDLPCTVRVAAVGCEEIGLLGSERLAATTDLDRVKAVVNVDGAGRHRDLVAMTHASEATRRVAERVAAATRQPIQVDPDPHPFSDQWPFVRAGVPALQLHSDSGERGRGWGHTHADTLDKVDDRNVREHGMLTALLVRALAAADPPRLDRDALATTFREADFETGMRAAGLWPDGWE